MCIMQRSILTFGAVLAAAVAVAARPAVAEDVAAFYKGKTVTIVAAHESGTGFDIYARALQRHMHRHIPGNPTVVVQNMPGAGGVVGANWLYNIAPKDGTTFGTFVFTAPFALFGAIQMALYGRPSTTARAAGRPDCEMGLGS